MPACDASKNAGQCKAPESRFLRLRRGIDHPLPYCFAGVEFILFRNDHMTAFGQAARYFCKIEGAKANANRASLHDSVSHHQRFIDEEGTRRHLKSMLISSGKEVKHIINIDHLIVCMMIH